MPVLFTPAATRMRRRRNGRRKGSSIGGSRPNTVVLILSWTAALMAIIAVFLGGAGLIMIGAGHRTAATFGLTGLGGVAAIYLAWFLSVGPGREPEKASPVWTPRTTSLVPPVDRPVVLAETPARRLRCWFCGCVEAADNRLVWGDRAAICMRCIATAERAAASIGGRPTADPSPTLGRFHRIRQEPDQEAAVAHGGSADPLLPEPQLDDRPDEVRRAG